MNGGREEGPRNGSRRVGSAVIAVLAVGGVRQAIAIRSQAASGSCVTAPVQREGQWRYLRRDECDGAPRLGKQEHVEGCDHRASWGWSVDRDCSGKQAAAVPVRHHALAAGRPRHVEAGHSSADAHCGRLGGPWARASDSRSASRLARLPARRGPKQIGTGHTGPSRQGRSWIWGRCGPTPGALSAQNVRTGPLTGRIAWCCWSAPAPLLKICHLLGCSSGGRRQVVRGRGWGGLNL